MMVRGGKEDLLFNQSGIDANGFKIYTFHSQHLPPFATQEYEQTYDKVISKLPTSEKFIIVFFSTIHQATPWSFIVSHYYKLDPKLRKNLEKLFLVFPSTWTRLLFQSLNMIVSQKFLKKLVWVESLETLSNHIPLRYLDIPDQMFVDEAQRGVSIHGLEFKMREQLTCIPVLVRDCCKFIQDEGVSVEGIFRISGSKLTIDLAIRKWNLGVGIDVGKIGSVHAVASILKQFFRDSPETIFPDYLMEFIFEFVNENDNFHEKIPTFVKRALFPKLPKTTVELFSFLFQTLFIVHCSSGRNRMVASNLAIIWTPNFLKGNICLPKSDIFKCVVEYCIAGYIELFNEKS